MRITSQSVLDALIASLGDVYSRKILLNTINMAKSVEELSQSQEIPIATAYRRVNEMREVGILSIESTLLTETGAKFPLYRSSFKTIHVYLEHAEIIVEVELNEDVTGRLTRLWSTIRGDIQVAS